MRRSNLGILYGIGAYALWGLFPLYWPLLKPASALEIVSHRAVWTLVFCLIILSFKGALKSTFALARKPKVALRLCIASFLISINWLIYIWATNHEHVVEASLGYYINPLVMILLGVVVLRERMRIFQWISVAIATIGVLILTIDYGRLPWIGLGIAFSWGGYSLVKKQLGLGALEGLAIETAFVFLPYFLYLSHLNSTGEGQFGHTFYLTILLISGGAVTAIPLLLFNGAATRLPLSVTGLLQYINPTLQFSCGVLIYHEDMPAVRWIGFFTIWLSLIALAIDLIRSSRAVDNSIT